MKKVVTIGGGGGHAAIISILKDLPIELSALVNTVDDGGSSGRLMRERGVHHPGEVRKILSAWNAQTATTLEPRNADGHPAGNLLLADLEQKTGSFQKAIDEIRQQFGIAYHVFPQTSNSPVLHALTESGLEISGQSKVTDHIRSHPNDPFTKLWITPLDSPLSPETRTALLAADFILVTMGDLYASVASAFCIRELLALWPSLRAKVIWMPNFAVLPGHVHYHTTSEALVFFQSLNPNFKPDIVIAHDYTLTQEEQQRLQDRGYILSGFDVQNLGFTVITSDLLDHSYAAEQQPNDIVHRSPVAHGGEKLKTIFKQLLV